MSTESDSPVSTEIVGDVAVVTMDDGKANAFSHANIDAIHAGLDQAAAEAGAVVITGREGRFSAGYDLSVMSGSEADRVALVKAGAELFMRVYGFELPVVAACNGHALAAGALLLLSADTRFGANIEKAKLGLNEVSIGMTLPLFGIELAQERLSKRHVNQATVLAQVYNPTEAVDVGYLDHLVEPDALHTTAVTHAQGLAEYVRRGALAGTKLNLRGPMIERVLAGLDADLNGFSVDA